MKKSFHWHLFVRIFVATTLLFVANRIIAKYLTGEHMIERIESNIAATFDRCRNDAADEPAFLTCAAKNNQADALANVSEFYVLCGTAGTRVPAVRDAACARSLAAGAGSQDSGQEFGDSVRLARPTVDGEAWLAFSLKSVPEGPRLLVRQADVLRYVDSIYVLRNRIIRYMSPILVVALALLTLYMTKAAMRPIRQLETSLRGLSSSNLDKPLDLLPPYREFESFVTVFEQLRERLNKSFLQARRFAADASHELRTPLTILRGNTERLIEELPTGSEAQVRMRLIGDEIERLIEITEKLLLLSRADANSILHTMEPVSLSMLLTDVALDAMAFHPGLKINSEIAPDIWFVCDRSLMLQLIHNLYSNAAKYNVAGGWIKFSLALHEEKVVLSVENPCDNIPADLAERAFQRFYRGEVAHSREIDGLGLGLSLSREIARLHGATLVLQVSERKTVIASFEGKKFILQRRSG